MKNIPNTEVFGVSQPDKVHPLTRLWQETAVTIQMF